jgi:nitroimidazol reductase NimA-like FMN-containing flavoprotein (pyridoxamine 5'-phosphate oxidase superfamily)
VHSVTSSDDVLSEDECRALLSSRTLGRVAFTSGALPVIAPVEYVYGDGVITFRTESALKLGVASHGDVLAFEIDAFDHQCGVGWTVLALGRATILTAGEATVPTLDESDPDATRYHYVRLHCELISGRRLHAFAD